QISPTRRGRGDQNGAPIATASPADSAVRNGEPAAARRAISQARRAKRTPCSSWTRWKSPRRCAHPYVHSGSQLCTTQWVPAAVYEYGSTLGMPAPATMSRPVRRWVNMELSTIGSTPSLKPNRTRTATKSDSRLGERRRLSRDMGGSSDAREPTQQTGFALDDPARASRWVGRPCWRALLPRGPTAPRQPLPP